MGTITMIASGKDGVGKTGVSVFTGAALARMGKKVLVIELDSGLRSIDIVSGVYSRIVYDLSDVLSGRCEHDKAIVRSPLEKNLYVMSAPFNSGNISAERFVKLCTVLSASYDYVIIDTASSTGAILTAASTAMKAIIVTSADPVSIRGSRLIADRLYDMSIQDVRLLINRLVPERVYAGAVPNLDYCIDAVGARLIGVIPESDGIALASAGIGQLKPGSRESKIFSNIAQRIEGEEVPLLVR